MAVAHVIVTIEAKGVYTMSLRGVSMTRVSARAYMAAGVSLIAVGAVVTNPVSTPLPDVHLPTARTVQVNLTAAEKWLQQAAAKNVDVARLRDAVHTMVVVAQADAASVPNATSSVAAGAGAAAKKVTTAVSDAVDVNRRIDGAAVAPRQAAVASAQAAVTGPDLARIVGIPLLAVSLATDTIARAGQITFDLAIAASDVLIGLATQNQQNIAAGQFFFNGIPNHINEEVADVQFTINLAAEAFGFPDPFPGTKLPVDPAFVGAKGLSGVAGALASAVGTEAVKGGSTVDAATPQEAKTTKSGRGLSAPNTEKPVSTPHTGSSVGSTSADDSQPSSSESTTHTTRDSNTKTDEAAATGGTTTTADGTTNADGSTKTEDTIKQPGETSSNRVTKSGHTSKSGGASKADGTVRAGVSTKSGGTSAAGGASNTGGAKAGKAGAHSARSSGSTSDRHGAAKDHKHDK